MATTASYVKERGGPRRAPAASRRPEDDRLHGWWDLDRNRLNRDVRQAKVQMQLLATCAGCGFLFFVDLVGPDARPERWEVDDGRIEGRTHRRCGGRIRLWRL